EVGTGAPLPPLPRIPAAAAPELNRRNLRKLLHVEERAEHRVVRCDVDQRILGWRKHAIELVQPLVPRRIAPVVVHPEETALEQIGAQPFDLRVGQLRSAPVLDADVWALIQVWIGESNHEGVRFAGRVLTDAHLRQLAKPFREVALRVGIIRRPSLSARFTAVARVHHAPVFEPVAERVGVGEAWAYSEESSEASPKLRPRDTGESNKEDEGDDECKGCRRSHLSHRLHLSHPSHRWITAESCRATGSTPPPSS